MTRLLGANGRFLINREVALRSTEIDSLRQQNAALLDELSRTKDSTAELNAARAETTRVQDEFRTRAVQIEVEAKRTAFSEIQPVLQENTTLHQQVVAQASELATLRAERSKYQTTVNTTEALEKRVGVLLTDNYDLKQQLEVRANFHAVPKGKRVSKADARRHEYMRRHGGLFDEKITVRVLPSQHLIDVLPLSVPLDQTLDRYTKGQNGRVRAWFNCSIGQYGGKNWMMYRCEAYPFWTASRAAICQMTDQWEIVPKTSDYLLLKGRKAYEKAEDPRFCLHDGHCLVSYNDREKQRIGRLKPDMTVEDSTAITLVGMTPQPCEKNWAFLSYEKTLYAIHTITPHILLRIDWNKATLVKKLNYEVDWPYGTPRGGTSCIPHNGRYYHFFHSSHDIAGLADCPWKDIRRYHAGVVVYAGKPPFKPIAISKFPLISALDREIPPYPNLEWREHFACMHSVVFPAGAVRNSKNDGWVVSLGIHDVHCAIAEIPDSVIEKNLH